MVIHDREGRYGPGNDAETAHQALGTTEGETLVPE